MKGVFSNFPDITIHMFARNWQALCIRLVLAYFLLHVWILHRNSYWYPDGITPIGHQHAPNPMPEIFRTDFSFHFLVQFGFLDLLLRCRQRIATEDEKTEAIDRQMACVHPLPVVRSLGGIVRRESHETHALDSGWVKLPELPTSSTNIGPKNCHLFGPLDCLQQFWNGHKNELFAG